MAVPPSRRMSRPQRRDRSWKASSAVRRLTWRSTGRATAGVFGPAPGHFVHCPAPGQSRLPRPAG
jgi:hypothetical protein